MPLVSFSSVQGASRIGKQDAIDATILAGIWEANQLIALALQNYMSTFYFNCIWQPISESIEVKILNEYGEGSRYKIEEVICKGSYGVESIEVKFLNEYGEGSRKGNTVCPCVLMLVVQRGSLFSADEPDKTESWELKWLCLYSMYAAQDCECACCKSCTKQIALALEKVIPFVIYRHLMSIRMDLQKSEKRVIGIG
ncbi:hypothetical protein Tco_0303265 [Tanacetum coccineum]